MPILLTVALENGAYCYCEADCGVPFDSYIENTRAAQAAAARAPTLTDTNPERLFFVSSMPWLSFTGLTLPTPSPADSNPRLTIGKYYEQSGRILLPVSVLVNHALADGRHIARFYTCLTEHMDAFVRAEENG